MITKMKDTNLRKLKARWLRFRGDTHNLTFAEYVRLNFRLTNQGLRRCGIRQFPSLVAWLNTYHV